MASGPVCRTQRPNTWLHRPMLQTFKKVLANSAPSTHGTKQTRSKAVMARRRAAEFTHAQHIRPIRSSK
jgi:hypothetical protein